MEAVSYLAGEVHSDHPSCACPVISPIMRAVNDAIESDTERNRLLAGYVERLVGSKMPHLLVQRLYNSRATTWKMIEDITGAEGLVSALHEKKSKQFLDAPQGCVEHRFAVLLTSIVFHKSKALGPLLVQSSMNAATYTLRELAFQCEKRDYFVSEYLKLADNLLKMGEVKEKVPSKPIPFNIVSEAPKASRPA